MNKRIGCMTFHGSYNYGSSLQTYALKTAIENSFSNVSYSVINYRNAGQTNMYKSIFEKRDLKSIYLRLFSLTKKKELATKGMLFEKFFEKFNLTAAYTSEDELKKAHFDFDYLLCGSDQVWNINAVDFDWPYFLNFKDDCIKISYACSAGTKNILLDSNQSKIITSELKKFSSISVRDKNTQGIIKKLGFDSMICADPTLLLTKEEWEKLILEANNDLPLINQPYILFYDLKRDKTNWKIAKQIAKELKIPILITTLPFPRVISNSIGMKKNYACGPVEFLKYISKASLILTSSFHGTVLSCILNKPFFVINSATDERIKSFANDVDIHDRMINDILDCNSITKDCLAVSFENINNRVKQLREESILFLKRSLGYE